MLITDGVIQAWRVENVDGPTPKFFVRKRDADQCRRDQIQGLREEGFSRKEANTKIPDPKKVSVMTDEQLVDLLNDLSDMVKESYQ